MKIQDRLAGIAEGLYFLNHHYERDLAAILKPEPIKNGKS
jgi:hypothetical protein